MLLNAVPIYIGFRFIGKKFTLYSCLMIVLTSVLTDMLPGYAITYDTLLISIFGGMINGLAISLCLAVNATSGGTDFIAIYLSDKKGIDSWNMVLGLNVIILAAAGVLFGWDKALYSIIFQYASTQVLHELYKKYQQNTVLVVTNHARDVYEAIARVCNHRGYESNQRSRSACFCQCNEDRAAIRTFLPETDRLRQRYEKCVEGKICNYDWLWYNSCDQKIGVAM